MKNVIQNELKPFRDQILFAYLFGSYGQGTASKTSDIDIGVFLKYYQSVKHFFDVKIDFYTHLNRALKRNDIDIVIMNNCENIILLNRIINDGIVVYDQDESKRLGYEQKILHRAIDFQHKRKMVIGT